MAYYVGSAAGSAVGSHACRTNERGQDAVEVKRTLAKRRVPSGGTTAQAICADSASHVAMTIETLWRFVAVCA